MLLKYILGSSAHTNGLIFCCWSPEQDSNTRSKCSFTESFLQVKFSAEHKNSVIINDGKEPLNRILWHVSTMPGAPKVVWVKPGSLMYFETLDNISNQMQEKFENDFNTEYDWGMMKSSLGHFAILNPVHNDCFQGSTIEEWEEKCKANNLKVEVVEQKESLFLEKNKYEENRKDFLELVDKAEVWKDNEFAGQYTEQIKNMTASEREEILSFRTKTLVYYKGMNIPSEFKSHYDVSLEFDTIEELEKIIQEERDNVTWLFGLKLTLPEAWWRYGHYRLEKVAKSMMATPNSILYGYTFENNDIIKSTFGDVNIHV